MTEAPPKPIQDNSREARLRAALRDNLRRRKDQARRRADSVPTDPGEDLQLPDKDGET